MKFLKKKCYLITIMFLCIIRFFISYNISSFYIYNLPYDDVLMVSQMKYLINGDYLGLYSHLKLVKGIMFPVFLFLSRTINVSYSILLTMLYISACIYFAISIKNIISDKKIRIIIFAFLLFNPISYSSDIFQRLYRNSLSIIEMLFFFGSILGIIGAKKNIFVYYFVLGISMTALFLTRDDNIWAIIVFIIVLIYKLYKNINVKNILVNFVPIFIIVIGLNIVCYINYKNYNIYTYNEITKSYFKDAYIKILQIKDNDKKDRVSIPKSTLLKLAEASEKFGFSKEEIEIEYSRMARGKGEIYNGNIIWYLRNWIQHKFNFKDGKEANQYYYELSIEIDQLFEEGKLEKEFAIPIVNMYMPTLNELKNLPKNLIQAIWYTASYKNIKTFSEEDISTDFEYDNEVGAYAILYLDYHNAENIIDNNPIGIEIIRNIYKYFTIIFSIIALIIYMKNIKVKDKLNLVIHIVLITYLIIICGVTYTHTTAFDAIRYCYLSNVYILQSLFILLNLYRLYSKYINKKHSENYELKILESGELDDFSNNSSI